MTIKQVKTGWQVNIQPGGRGAKRVKKTFEKKADALAWERHVRAKVQESPDWAPARKDARPLTELCTLWFNLHGQGLRAGEDTYKRLLAMCEAMGNPRAETFTAEVFAEYRKRRIDDGLTPNNMNREHAYLRAVFNELIRLGHWKRDNPLKLLRAFKIQERQLSYLKAEEISQLLVCLAASNNRNVELLIRRELFMRPHRRHACRQSTSGPALACSPTSSCVLSPPRAAWPWFAPEPCCQSHASNRH